MNSECVAGRYAAIVICLCVLVSCVILIAGLWPFHAPKNDVAWNADGLFFGRHGIAVSRQPFRFVKMGQDASCSVEIMLTPALVTGHGAILSFDSSRDSSSPFVLWQYGADLAIQRYSIDDHGVPRRPWLKVDHVFQARKSVLLTITSGTGTTVVYVDGVEAARSSIFGMVREDLSGQMVLANSTMDEGWSGKVRQLAIYDRELTPAEVAERFSNGFRNQPPATTTASMKALYRFDEGRGQVVRNQADSETDLWIPVHYFVLHPMYLRPMVSPFDHTGLAQIVWSYRKDIALNVAGFVPVGIVFMAYFSSVKGLRGSTVAVILLGFVLSFVIETLQRFLPTRDSGMTDLVTNTAGTILGVVLYKVCWARLLNRITSSSFPGMPRRTSVYE